MKTAIVLLVVLLVVVGGCRSFDLVIGGHTVYGERPLLGASPETDNTIAVITLVASAAVLGMLIAGGS